MNNRSKSLIYDVIQVSFLIYFLLTGPVIPSSAILAFLQIVAFLILGIAAWDMRKTKYYRVPDVGKQNGLVKTGIFSYIRNPMYLSQLVFCGVLLINSFSLYRGIIYIIYIVNFLSKINYEEKLLSTHFSEFEHYKKTTWRLIPYLY
ncbi:hypothetical protein COY32_01950 [candidate division WWE3 bacterium CG_4_10_14_0_2_um_filter_41_14]|uniref:Isoprenylcysteine carboxylmethyltransferase family protein n=1 Tax=candidate division WWE3 bacterium CG_4_10_14_0_2_um_filter_41_14 TaxID=1975072 RepID=A0A2M7TKG3_UNCKA|nr:MAG: hypothetical protein COY32_01950 [candidate division WWE3 bacterium CG_4_10_14_0_2_um_filter_41_14]